jgi:magnesium chelatase accessory protein
MSAHLALPAFWPHRDHSHRVQAAGHDWHVQVMGQGPDLLLLHGAGGANLSFRGLMPLLAPHYRCIAPDLPGQGYTRMGRRGRAGLEAMAADITALCAAQGWHPAAIVGHSAGAALALRIAEAMPLDAVIGINAALGQFEGVQGVIYPIMAKALALAPFVPALFSRFSGSEAKVNALLSSTGSPLDPEGRQLYRHLVSRSSHVDGTLAMMADWSLDSLLARLPGIRTPTLLITSDKDNAVPPQISHRAAARMPRASLAEVAGFGHLVHEEAPQDVARLILPFIAHQRTHEAHSAPAKG